MTSESARPLTPPVNKNASEKLVFFESEDSSGVDNRNSVKTEDQSLFEDVVFDPTATGAFPIDLDEPVAPDVEVEVEESQPFDPTETVSGSIVDLVAPKPSFSVPFERIPPKEPVVPSSEGWLQQSLFAGSPPPASRFDEGAALQPPTMLDRLNYGNVENIEDVRWFHRPIIWLVLGLLAVLILFIVLLVQDV